MIKIRIKATAFTDSLSPLYNVPTNRASIPVGVGLAANGAHTGVLNNTRDESMHLAPTEHQSRALRITADGCDLLDDVFARLSFNSYKSSLADLMEKGIVEVLADGTPLSIPDMLTFS